MSLQTGLVNIHSLLDALKSGNKPFKIIDLLILQAHVINEKTERPTETWLLSKKNQILD